LKWRFRNCGFNFSELTLCYSLRKKKDNREKKMAEAFYVPLLISTALNLITGLFATKPTQKAQEPNLRVPKSDYGSSLPKVYGTVRVEGNKFFPDTKDKMYRVETSVEKKGGKGFGGSQKVETKTVYGTFAVLFSQGQCSLDRIIVNGRQIEESHNFFQTYCTWFDGSQTTPWSEMVAKEGTPHKDIAYKGVNYIGFKDVPLDEYGNQIPQQISAVIQDDEFGSQPTLDHVVGSICQRAGIPANQIDVTNLSTIILRDGIIVPETGDGYKKTLEDLMGFYLFTAIESKDGKIQFLQFKQTDETALSIPPQHYIPVSESGIDNQLFIKTTEAKSELPNKITVKYFNTSQNWDADEIVEYFEEFTKENNISIDAQLTSYAYEIKERARLILRHLYVTQRNTYTFSLPGTYINQLELLRLILLPNGETVQIHQLNLGADFKLDVVAKKYSGGLSYAYTPLDSENGKQPPLLPDPTLNLPSIYVLDIPQIEEYPPNTVYLCATGICTIQASIDEGITYPKSTYHQSISSIGTVLSSLADSSGLDVTNTFDIEIESGQFDTISQAEFDSGDGLGLIAYQQNGYWIGELIRFRDVAILTSTTRRISYIQRKQYGTTFAPTQNKFFYLRGGSSYYSIIQGDADLIGVPIHFRPLVSPWQNLATTPVVIVTPVGTSYRPLAPTNATATIDEDGNIQLFWEYNAKFNPYNNSQADVTFEIEILKPDSSYRLLTSREKNVLYLINDRTADNVTTPLNVRIYAISSVVGRGNPLIAVLTPVLVPNSIFGTGIGVKGTTTISGNYTVQESDNNKIIVGYTTALVEYSVTFPSTLSNGFTCWVVNAWGNNYASYYTIVGSGTNLTRLENNRIKVGDSRQYLHVSNGTYLILGKNKILYDFIGVAVNSVLGSNGYFEVQATGLSLTFEPNAVEGDFIGIKTLPALDYATNPITLLASTFPIEGSSSFTINTADDRYLFYFAGTQWIFISRTAQLSAVATSGDYNDLINTPTLATVAISGDYSDLINAPTLATVATSGDYNDLINAPTGGGGGNTDIIDIWLYGG